MNPITSPIASVGFFLYLLVLSGQAQAQSKELPEMPKANVEELPLPHELGAETMDWDESPSAAFFERPLNCTRINRYEIWQFYEVGHQGKFRPRVIYAPFGSFYLDDGRPYPWISNHPLDFMPYAVSP